eukprot:TRINITY_DN7260_c0_g1_i3.p1 TRINITY_DN7260_c0_g1~~TRINITY_DN7260_c0_g1_i3.p1  ORF type:complete len:120 (-),score=17.32 TRINITY_DN7260_c0_g1_i3:356-715(-)
MDIEGTVETVLERKFAEWVSSTSFKRKVKLALKNEDTFWRSLFVQYLDDWEVRHNIDAMVQRIVPDHVSDTLAHILPGLVSDEMKSMFPLWLNSNIHVQEVLDKHITEVLYHILKGIFI